MAQIIYNNIILDEWKYFGAENYNLYRLGIVPLPDKSFNAIGFVVNSRTQFVKNLNDAYWIIDFAGQLKHLEDIFYKTAGRKLYLKSFGPIFLKYHQLEEWKEVIDKFLIKMNKLTALV